MGVPVVISLGKNGSARIEFTDSSRKINGIDDSSGAAWRIYEGERLIYRDAGGRCLDPGRRGDPGALLERER